MALSVIFYIHIVVADTQLEPNEEAAGPIMYNTTIAGGPKWSIEWDPQHKTYIIFADVQKGQKLALSF